MTIDEFFDVLDKHSTRFYLDGISDKSIRSVTRRCPICEVATLLGKNPENWRNNYRDVYENIGLSANDAGDIVLAADVDSWLQDRQRIIRNRLLKYVG